MALQFDQLNNQLKVNDSTNANAPIVLQPSGTGAVQAQLADSTTAGGNARGANAVDWQTNRNAAAQVASGLSSTISGGYLNTASASGSTIAGGYNNSNAGSWAFLGGGYQNTIPAVVNQSPATLVGGFQNNASGYSNFIGGGALNSGTATAIVTTQVTTIAVTAGTTFYISSVNASIKVGQLVQGTGVTGQTYATSAVTTGTPAVMATSSIAVTTGILTVGTLSSGTIVAGQVLTGTGVPAGTYIVSNISGSGAGSTWNTNITTAVASTTITGTAYTFTISQAATTAAGVTLSFYTPHGVVVGGGNNQATGSYSFIGGGGNAGDSTRRNLASGDWSTICGGAANTASGGGSSILGGGYDSSSLVFYPNTASGSMATIVGGGQNTSSDFASATIGSYAGTANARVSVVAGGYYGSSRSIVGNFVTAASRSPVNQNPGVSQAALLVIGRQTTDATATVLTSDTNAASGTNQVILPNNSAYYVRGSIVAGVTGAGNSSSWTFQGTIKRGVGVGTTAIVGAGITASLVSQDAGAATWAVAITADTTNGGLAVTVTGQAATTIRWVCKIETTEMTY